MFTTNASRYMRGNITKSKPRNFVMSGRDTSVGGVGGVASTFAVSVTGASACTVVFNTVTLGVVLAAVAGFLAVDLRVRRRVEDVVKCETCELNLL